MLQDQGFNINLQTLEVAAWGNLLYDKPGGGEGDMIDCGWCTGSPEPDLVIRTHFHSSSKRICGYRRQGDRRRSRQGAECAGSIEERKKILQTETLPTIAEKVSRPCPCSPRSSSTPTTRSSTACTSTPMARMDHRPRRPSDDVMRRPFGLKHRRERGAIATRRNGAETLRNFIEIRSRPAPVRPVAQRALIGC